MLEEKGAQFFPKVAQKIANAVLHKSEVFQNSLKSFQEFWIILQEIRPIWSHWPWSSLLEGDEQTAGRPYSQTCME